MSVRKLNDRPWLIEDKKKQEELKIKADLSQNPKKIVFLTRKGTEKAGLEVIALIQESKRNQIQPDSHHPLERAGLSIQEDLCLIRRHHEGWLLEAASLCFPSHPLIYNSRSENQFLKLSAGLGLDVGLLG